MWSNNDGMDPNWKPDPIPDAKIIQKISSVYYTLEMISSRFDKWSDEDLDRIEKEGKVLSTNFDVKTIKKIRKLLEETK